MVSFAYSGPGKPVCLHHTFGPKQFDIHVREYEVGPYLLDPFYKATANGVRSGIYKLAELAPDQFYKSEYYRSYYVQTGPVDEIAFFTPGKEGWTVVTSLMRAPSQPSFTAHELRTLRIVEPLIRSIAETHWRTDERLKAANQVEDDKEVMRRTVQDALEARGMPPLTPRELQVVGLVLEGHSSEFDSQSSRHFLGHGAHPPQEHLRQDAHLVAARTFCHLRESTNQRVSSTHAQIPAPSRFLPYCRATSFISEHPVSEKAPLAVPLMQARTTKVLVL